MLLAAPSLLRAQEGGGACPPKTRVDNVEDKYGKTTVVDPYRWLEDQDSKETRAWIAAQDKCTEAALGKLPGRGRDRETVDASSIGSIRIRLPVEQGGRYFFTKRLAGQELAQICMRRSANGADEVLVDPTPWSADHSASAIIEKVSKDGKFLFYGRREGGQDEVTVHVLDIDAHKELPDVLPLADYGSVEPRTTTRECIMQRPRRMGRGRITTRWEADPASDKLLFGEKLDKEKELALETV